MEGGHLEDKRMDNITEKVRETVRNWNGFTDDLLCWRRWIFSAILENKSVS
jgi:hypothetical protein